MTDALVANRPVTALQCCIYLHVVLIDPKYLLKTLLDVVVLTPQLKHEIVILVKFLWNECFDYGPQTYTVRSSPNAVSSSSGSAGGCCGKGRDRAMTDSAEWLLQTTSVFSLFSRRHYRVVLYSVVRSSVNKFGDKSSGSYLHVCL